MALIKYFSRCIFGLLTTIYITNGFIQDGTDRNHGTIIVKRGSAKQDDGHQYFVRCNKRKGLFATTERQFECYKLAPQETEHDDRCLPLENRCDGKRQCKNGADEIGCNINVTLCPLSYIPCKVGQCIEKHKVQNQGVYSIPCKVGQCIEKHKVQNQGQDCSNFDEICASEHLPHIKKLCERKNKHDVLRKQREKETCTTAFCYDHCIQENRFCDGYVDCPDGRDEDPHTCTQDRPCIAGGVKCEQQKPFGEPHFVCIRERSVCDGYTDCVNGEDEDQQLCNANRVCPEPDQIACTNGQCIHTFSLCNGYEDCNDGTDESPEACSKSNVAASNCSSDIDGLPLFNAMVRVDDGTCEYVSSLCVHTSNDDTFKYTNLCADISCRVQEGGFVCPGDVKYCIHYQSVCDGFIDCEGGEDENETMCKEERKCFFDQFSCGDGRCIHLSLVCDGLPNCPDKSDENEELCRPDRDCGLEELYPCGDGQCVSSETLCNGEIECNNEMDEDKQFCSEMECVGEMIPCSESGTVSAFGLPTPKCLHKSYMCTSWYEVSCPNKSVKGQCEERQSSCPQGEVACGDGQCIKEESVCSNYIFQICNNGEINGETFCHGRECREGLFACGNGQCVSMERVCDGKTHCIVTGRDESKEICPQDDGISYNKDVTENTDEETSELLGKQPYSANGNRHETYLSHFYVKGNFYFIINNYLKKSDDEVQKDEDEEDS